MARQKTHEQFVKDLAAVTKTVVPLGNYSGAMKKILFKCIDCGHEWRTKPNYLLMGHGCPPCKCPNLRKTKEVYAKQVFEANPNIKLLSDYVTSRTKVKCECLVCGHVWDSKPDGLLDGKGCFCCFVKRMTKSHDEFVEQVAQVNPKLVVIGEYKKNDQKVECECLVCKTKFSRLAGDILRRTGCPNCAVYGYSSARIGYLYVCKFEDCVGYGISNKPKCRIQTHNKMFAASGIAWSLEKMFYGNGDEIRALESELKKSLPAHNIDLEGFKRESTSLRNYSRVLQIIDMFRLKSTSVIGEVDTNHFKCKIRTTQTELDFGKALRL